MPSWRNRYTRITQNPVGNAIIEGQYRFIILTIDYHTIILFTQHIV